MSCEIQVERLSGQPTEYWKQWKNTANVMRLQVKPPSTPVEENKVRFVCMSDTHSLTSHLKQPIPDGDVFLHAGDFTRSGAVSEVREFNAWLGKLPHKHKVVIAGNHELSFDPVFQGKDMLSADCRSGHIGSSILPMELKLLFTPTSRTTGTIGDCDSSCSAIKEELTNCQYLEDESITLYGLKVYGSPWQPEFGGWAFNLPRGRSCLDKWNRIPADTDILLTHSPPLGYGDLCSTGVRAGCIELLSTVQKRVQPKYHVYGHIHEGYGVRSDGKVVFVNASTCDINYLPCNSPVVFDVPLPAGLTK